MGQLCAACGFDREALARERAAEQAELDARLAERLQAEEFALQDEEEDQVGAAQGQALSLMPRGHHRAGGLSNRGTALPTSASWDLRNVLWESFPSEASNSASGAASAYHQDMGARLLHRQEQQQRWQWQQQQQRRPETSTQLRGRHFAAAFPGLVTMQPPVANHRGRSDPMGLLGELFGHQHVSNPAALFELLGELEPVPRGVEAAVVDANTTTLRHEASAADRSEGAVQSQCSVCLEQFKEGEELRMLPCMHRYHRGCIDRWLSRSPACPVCKHEIPR